MEALDWGEGGGVWVEGGRETVYMFEAENSRYCNCDSR